MMLSVVISASVIISAVFSGNENGHGNRNGNCNDNYIIRRCAAENTQTTCQKRFVGRNGDIPIATFDAAFDFDDTSVCSNDNNVATSSVPITQDLNQGPVGVNDPDYNVIQTNSNCFGGFRGIEPSCENDYTIWFPGEGSDNPNNITGPRVEASIFPGRPCYIVDGCGDIDGIPTNGDDPIIQYSFNGRADYICANLDNDGFFVNDNRGKEVNLFMTTCSLSNIDALADDGSFADNVARIEELESDAFGGIDIRKTLKYGSFLDEDCSFGLPDPLQFDIDKECIAGVVEHHSSQRSEDYVLQINGVNDIFMEFRAGTRFSLNFRNRVKVKFLCGDFKDIKYKAYRCKYNGPANDLGDGSSLRYYQFTANDCAELKNVDKLPGNSNNPNGPNLGPEGDECLAFLRRYRQCGDDYSYRILNEGDGIYGPGVVWNLDDSTCQNICNDVNCGDVDIEVDYLCPI